MRTLVEAERAADALVPDLQIGNGNGHVQPYLQDELWLLEKALRHNHTGTPGVEVNEHGRPLQQIQGDGLFAG